MHLGVKEISQVNLANRSGEESDKVAIPDPENDRAAYIVEATEIGSAKVVDDDEADDDDD